MLLRDAIRETATLLERAGLADSARREAEWLAEGALRLSRAQCVAAAGRTLAPAEAARLRDWTRRRTAGEPLQYILGDVEFCGLRIEVGPGVLIPRPETEKLVELALAELKGEKRNLEIENRKSKIGEGAPMLDLCTGSGCVALAIAHALQIEKRKAKIENPVFAVDLSPDALGYARRNQDALGLAGVTFLEGDLYAPLPPDLRFAVITANPPYIAPEPYGALPPEVRAHEPELALRAEEDGLAVFRRIAEGACSRLLPGGRLFCELDTTHGDAAREILARNGFDAIAFLPDCFGKPRFAAGRRTG